jgi:hypothetical protein
MFKMVQAGYTLAVEVPVKAEQNIAIILYSVPIRHDLHKLLLKFQCTF